MNSMNFTGKTSFTCTCTHGGGGHMVACDFFVPTKEQYVAACKERDEAREVIKGMLKVVDALNTPQNGQPYWLR